MVFLDAAVGGRSVGVPGVLRMLELAHGRHGRLPWHELFTAAIRIAEDGFELSPKPAKRSNASVFCVKTSMARKLYRGNRVVNREYGETLRAQREAVRACSTRATSPRTSCSPCAHTKKPAISRKRTWQLPRGGARGGVRPVSQLARLLHGAAELRRRRRPADPRVLERNEPRAPAQSAAALHFFAEAGKLAYADRARYLADPDFITVPVKSLISPSYLEKRQTPSAP